MDIPQLTRHSLRMRSCQVQNCGNFLSRCECEEYGRAIAPDSRASYACMPMVTDIHDIVVCLRTRLRSVQEALESSWRGFCQLHAAWEKSRTAYHEAPNILLLGGHMSSATLREVKQKAVRRTIVGLKATILMVGEEWMVV